MLAYSSEVIEKRLHLERLILSHITGIKSSTTIIISSTITSISSITIISCAGSGGKEGGEQGSDIGHVLLDQGQVVVNRSLRY